MGFRYAIAHKGKGVSEAVALAKRGVSLERASAFGYQNLGFCRKLNHPNASPLQLSYCINYSITALITALLHIQQHFYQLLFSS